MCVFFSQKPYIWQGQQCWMAFYQINSPGCLLQAKQWVNGKSKDKTIGINFFRRFLFSCETRKWFEVHHEMQIQQAKPVKLLHDFRHVIEFWWYQSEMPWSNHASRFLSEPWTWMNYINLYWCHWGWISNWIQLGIRNSCFNLSKCTIIVF